MKTKIQSLIKLLLDLHKILLDAERERYEKKNGSISNNNEYFNIVVNHDDFKWLRSLSEAIALIDEESEADNIDIKKINQLLADLSAMLSGNNKSEFSVKYGYEIARGVTGELDARIKSEIDNILNYPH